MGQALRDVRQEEKAADVLRDSVSTDMSMVHMMTKDMMARMSVRLSAYLPRGEAGAAAAWAQNRTSFLRLLLVWWGHLVRGNGGARQAADGSVRDLVQDAMRYHPMFRQYSNTLAASARAAQSPEAAVVAYIRQADEVYFTLPRGMGAALDTADWAEHETIWELWRKLCELAAVEGGNASARVGTIWVARLEAKYNDQRVVQGVRDAIGTVLDQFRTAARQAARQADVGALETQLRAHSRAACTARASGTPRATTGRLRHGSRCTWRTRASRS